MQYNGCVMNATVLSNREVKEGCRLMSLLLPPSFALPFPGQFIMIRMKDRQEPLLARPLSISGFRRLREQVQVELLYRIAGRGTHLFARLGKGEKVDVSGPFGHPFEIQEETRNIILVSGGIGIAPIRYLLSWLQASGSDFKGKIDVFMGAKTAGELLDAETTRSFCEDLHICTDDGSMGHPGFVTDFLEKRLASYPPGDTLICACGPAGMIRHLSEIVARYPVACQVSLEERMACGHGACLGCAVAIRGRNGEKQFQRVCREGPVFDIRDILWE